MFCIYLRTNSDLCHLQHKLIGFYNRDEKCLLRGTNWVFKWSSLRFVFKGLNIVLLYIWFQYNLIINKIVIDYFLLLYLLTCYHADLKKKTISLHNILPSLFRVRFNVRNFKSSSTADFGPPTFVNSLMGKVNLKVSVMGSSWNLNRSVAEGLSTSYSETIRDYSLNTKNPTLC